MLLKRKVDIETAKADIEGVNSLHKTAQNKSAQDKFDRYYQIRQQYLHCFCIIMVLENIGAPVTRQSSQTVCTPNLDSSID